MNHYPIPDYPTLSITSNLRVYNSRSRKELTRYSTSDSGRLKLDPLPLLSNDARVPFRRNYTISSTLQVYNQYGDELNVYVRFGGSSLNIHLLAEKARLIRVRHSEELAELQSTYTDIPFQLAYKLPPATRSSLLCLRFPELIPSWDDNKETLATLTYASLHEFWWHCQNHNLRYLLTPAARTCQKRGCPQCVPQPEDYAKACQGTISTAAADEQWVAELLRQHPAIKSTEAVGQEGNPIDDVVVVLKGETEERSLQIKHLIKAKKSEQYTLQMKEYPPDMLVVGVNQERDRFFVAFARELPASTVVTLTFTLRAQTYKQAKFLSSESFLATIVELLPRTILTKDLLNRYTPEAEMELAMKKRLQQACQERGIAYSPAENNGTATDCYLGGKPVQLKAVGRRVYQKYVVSIHRRAAGTVRPYNENDLFDFLIIELLIAPGQFCIIPRSFLTDNGYIGEDGKDKLLLYPPGHSQNDLFTPYWNAFSLLC